MTLQDIDLQVVVNVVNQEAHVLPQLQSQPEYGLLIQMLHAAYFRCPDVLQFELDTLDRKQEAEEGVVLLGDVGAEHQVDWPLAVVVERQSTPRVTLVCLDGAFEGPVLDEENIREVLCLLREAQVCGTIVQTDVVSQLKRYGDEWLYVVLVLLVLSGCVNECDIQLFLRSVL